MEQVEILADGEPSALGGPPAFAALWNELRSSPTANRRRWVDGAQVRVEDLDVEILADGEPSALAALPVAVDEHAEQVEILADGEPSALGAGAG